VDLDSILLRVMDTFSLIFQQHTSYSSSVGVADKMLSNRGVNTSPRLLLKPRLGTWLQIPVVERMKNQFDTIRQTAQPCARLEALVDSAHLREVASQFRFRLPGHLT